VNGDLAVLEGPATIAGHVRGRVVAINASLVVRASARVDGDVLVVGGTADVEPGAAVRGTVRAYLDSLQYREEGDRLVPLVADTSFADLWARYRATQVREGFRLSLQTGKTYNRVEGLPILVGPGYRERLPWGSLDVEALAVVRTAGFSGWEDEDLGYSARAELRFGGGRGVRVAGTLYGAVRPVEAWQLSDAEVGLASFLVHRDYRDYYEAQGGGLEAATFTGADAEARIAWRDERWDSRVARDPFALVRNSEAWRDNPRADEGRFRVATATLRVDTRNVAADPRSGWDVLTEYEYGRGRVDAFAPLSPGVRDTTDRHVDYGRLSLDVRRYNRISPRANLDFRLFAAGWLHGDPLPAQRRLSMGGAGAIPGLDFRRTIGDVDASQCSMGEVPSGVPAQCDRVLLLQAEFRHDLRFAFGDVDLGIGRLRRWGREAQWVLFADAGRGWLVGPRLGDLRFAKGTFPPLDSYRADAGVGIDLAPVGLYLAKALSGPAQDLNFVIRLQRRF
jgi:hypothetical protein